MDTIEDWLRAVDAAGDDTTPRLAFADWLEERGDAASVARAEFVRKSIYAGVDGENGWTLQPHVHHPMKHLFRVPKLQDQEYLYRRGFVYLIRAKLLRLRGGASGSGVVPGVLPGVVREHPVERVEVTDLVIHPSGGNDTFYMGNLGVFPSQYWHELEDRASRAAVREAVSLVLLDEARAATAKETRG